MEKTPVLQTKLSVHGPRQGTVPPRKPSFSLLPLGACLCAALFSGWGRQRGFDSGRHVGAALGHSGVSLRPGRPVPHLAELCVRRRIISVVRAAAGGKHSPLNDYVSLDPSLFLAHQDFTFFGTAYHQQRNPEDVVIHEENLSTLEEAIRKGLTGLEAQVLACYLHGLSYAEIAEEVQRSTKSVDNAVQRIRRKIAQYLSRGEYSES